MTTAVWLSLFVMIVAPLACGGWATVTGLRTYRNARHFSRALNRDLLPIQVAASVAEDRVATVEAGQIRLQEALARLEQSRAELDILRRAAQETQERIKSLRSLFPG